MTVRWSSFFVFFSNYFIDSFKIKFTAFLVAVSFLHKKYFYKYIINNLYIYFWKQSIWGAEHGSFTLNLTEEDNWDRPFKHFSISGNHLVNIYCNEYGARLGSGSHTYNIDGSLCQKTF